MACGSTRGPQFTALRFRSRYDFLDAEVVVALEGHNGRAFGFQLRPNVTEAQGLGMLGILRAAFSRGQSVRLEYFRAGSHGRIVSVSSI